MDYDVDFSGMSDHEFANWAMQNLDSDVIKSFMQQEGMGDKDFVDLTNQELGQLQSAFISDYGEDISPGYDDAWEERTKELYDVKREQATDKFDLWEEQQQERNLMLYGTEAGLGGTDIMAKDADGNYIIGGQAGESRDLFLGRQERDVALKQRQAQLQRKQILNEAVQLSKKNNALAGKGGVAKSSDVIAATQMSEDNIAAKVASANMTRHSISTQSADAYEDFTSKSKHSKEIDDLNYTSQYDIKGGALDSNLALWDIEEDHALFKMRDDYNAMVIANLQDFISGMAVYEDEGEGEG